MQGTLIPSADACPACKHLRAAKMAHLNWLTHARNLLVGGEFSPTSAPLEATECKFGQWFYGEGSMFAELSEYQAIERLHTDLHSNYRALHELLDKAHRLEQGQRSSLLRRLTGNSEEVVEMRREAGALASELETISGTMLIRLSELEKRIRTRDF
jgi:hypothetical protein